MCLLQSNTILSSSSSLFTFLVSLCVLNEKFTWLKLSSVLLCMVGTIIVSLADASSSGFVYNAGWGDLLCLVSALLYAFYSTLIRKNLPDEASGEGKASTALFFGYLGLFNALLLTPVALIVHFTGIETFHRLSPMQLGLILCKGALCPHISSWIVCEHCSVYHLHLLFSSFLSGEWWSTLRGTFGCRSVW